MNKLLFGVAALALSAPLMTREPQEAKAPDIAGLWSRAAWKKPGDPMRFYYFHDKDGIGLYRYGRVGMNYTNSYDYSVRGDELSLRFRKTGEAWKIRFRIQPDPKDRNLEWLELKTDPREPGATRYFRQKSARLGAEMLAFQVDFPPFDAVGGQAPAGEDWGRMWTCERRFVTGGLGFRIYQLKDLGPDGSGFGWYHEGDYDEWSTEQLRYRVHGSRMELEFPIRNERAATGFGLKRDGGERLLELEEDPRNYWQSGRFIDWGRSFGPDDARIHRVLLPLLR